MDRLRQQMTQQRSAHAAGAPGDDARGHAAAPGDAAAISTACSERRPRGGEPDFQGFMDTLGSDFPGRPDSTSCSTGSRSSPAQMQSLLESLTPSSGASSRPSRKPCRTIRACRRRSPSWQRTSTGSGLASGRAGTRRRGDDAADARAGHAAHGASSTSSTGWSEDLRDAERTGRSGPDRPAQMRDVWASRPPRTAGARSSRLTKALEAAGYLERAATASMLTPQAIRKIGAEGARRYLGHLRRDRSGRHPDRRTAGRGGDRDATRASRTSSAIRSCSTCARRSGARSGAQGPGLPLRLAPRTSRSTAPSCRRGAPPCCCST